ncbi:MAG: hypothetical protein AB1499_12590 [Nitrospirota bacterium]
MNSSISNVLEIYRLVVQKRYSQADAARELGRKKNIAHSDVIPSCAKDLNIGTDKFEYFLESRDDFNFKNFLFRRFPEQQDQIERFFNTFNNTGDIPVLDLSKIIKPISHSTKKGISSHLILSSLKDKFLDWMARPDIPQDVKEELKGLITKIEG